MITKQKLETMSIMLGTLSIIVWALFAFTPHFAEARPESTATFLVETGENSITVSLQVAEPAEPIAAIAFNIELSVAESNLICTPGDTHTKCNPLYQSGVVRVNRVSYAEPIDGMAELITLNIDPDQSSSLIFDDIKLYTNDLETATATLHPNLPLAVELRGEAADYTSFLIASAIIFLFVLLIFITRRINSTLFIIPVIGTFVILIMAADSPATATRGAIKLGDTDCDGEVTIIDMLLIDQYSNNAITGQYLACPDSLNNPDQPNTMFLPACDVNLSSDQTVPSGTDCTLDDLNEIAECDVAVDNQFCTQTNQYTIIVNEIIRPSGEGDREVGASGTVVVSTGTTTYEHDFTLSTQLWNLTIPVCWINPTAENADGRTWTEEAVARTWETHSDVQFTGWGTCPAVNDLETIRIVVRDTLADGARTTGLGRQIRLRDEGMILNFTFRNWGQACSEADERKRCIEMIAVHEFGHALGFAHEQNRPDTPSWCNQEQGTDGDVLIGDWDPDSVMNYCSSRYLNGGNLSTGDIETVQFFYSDSGPPQPTSTHPRVGTNLDEVASYTPQYVFADAFKQSNGWSPREEGWSSDHIGNPQPPLDLDENGWPKSLPACDDPAANYCKLSTFLFDYRGMSYPSGRYHVTFDGTGELSFSDDAAVNLSASCLSDSCTPKRYALDVTPNNIMRIDVIKTDINNNGDYIKNIQVLMPGYGPGEPNEGKLFHADFIESIEPYGVLRFMDWMRTNWGWGGDAAAPIPDNAAPVRPYSPSTPLEWADRPKQSDATYSSSEGVPIEVMVKLVNEVNAVPWFNMSHQVSDAYVEAFATLVRDTVDPQTIYIEYSNEIWNRSFNQGNWIEEQGENEFPEITNGQLARFTWYGQRTNKICTIWKDVFGANANDIVCVVGAQANADDPDWVLDAYLNCTSPSSCAYDKIDAVSIAPYFGGEIGRSENFDTVKTWTKDDLFSHLTNTGVLKISSGNSVVDGRDSLLKAEQNMVKYVNAAQSRGRNLFAYEGGQHLVGVGDVKNNATVTGLFISAQKDDRMEDAYMRYLESWEQAGGELFVHFNNVSRYSESGSWGAREFYNEDTPKWRALSAFIEREPISTPSPIPSPSPISNPYPIVSPSPTPPIQTNVLDGWWGKFNSPTEHNGAVCYSSNDVIGDAWFGQSNWLVESGKTYKISFTAYINSGQSATDLHVFVTDQNPPHPSYFSHAFDASPTQSFYEHEFTMSEPTNAESNFAFLIRGGDASTLCVKDIQLTPITPISILPTPISPTPIPSTINILGDSWWSDSNPLTENNGAVCHTATGASDSPWDERFGQNNLPLENGKNYQVSFNAYTIEQPATEVQVQIIEQQPPYVAYGRFMFDVSSTPSFYKYEFTMWDAIDVGQFAFEVGGGAWTVCVDDVVFGIGGNGNPISPWHGWSNNDSLQLVHDNGQLKMSHNNTANAKVHTAYSLREVTAGQAYRVRFDVRADQNGSSTNVYLRNRDEPWLPLTDPLNIPINTQSQSVDHTFTAHTTDTDSILVFELQDDTQTIWLDNISLVDESGRNRVSNGTFDSTAP